MTYGCLECGWRTKSVKAAERAAFGDDGCPKCGGSDIDLVPSTPSPEPPPAPRRPAWLASWE